MTDACTNSLHRLRPPTPDTTRIATDLAVMLADGGQAISDLALLRDQPDGFSPAASTPVAWRLLAGIHLAARKFA